MPRLGSKTLALAAVVPVALATAIAGTLTAPWSIRPCAHEYSEGIGAGVLHLALGAEGNLYATESLTGKIVQFNPTTHRTRHFQVPKGTVLHDIVRGPDGNLWFGALNDRFGRLDPRTGKVTMFGGISKGSELHDLAWDRGYLYIAELKAGRLARFDPRTKHVLEGRFGLPAHSQIHSLRVLPSGDMWATLSNANRLARFDPAKQRFDKFVVMPISKAGPRDLVYVRSQHAIYLTLFAANKIVRYDLRTGRLTVYPTPLPRVSLAQAEGLARVEKLTFLARDPDEHALWSATFGGELIRFDLRTHKVRRVYCGVTFPSATAGMTTDREGRLWFNEAFPGRIARMDP